FDEAQKFIDKNKLVLPFEKAYCEYRLNQPEKALATIDSCNVNPLPVNLKELRAQVLYRLEKFNESLELYKDLMKNTSDDYDDERKTNFSAVASNVKEEFSGNRKDAVEVLSSLGDTYKYKPGVVSALVTLYLGLDNKPAASGVLKSAVDWYKKNASNDSGDLSDMWRQAAEFHLRGGEAETAAKSLEELLKMKPNDVKVLAQLVIAYAQFDAKKAQEISKRLPALETLTTASEIDALEAANWVMSIKAAKKSATAKVEQSPGTPGSDLQKKKKTHRKRKGKLPKNYNAEVAPDPERWLPRYERSGYRKKRDRRAKDVIKGSQGMSTAATNQL
uniref:Signal recognition particle subunit SRP72 n=1 Tax=Megaselia scalaris TaxID=36166 RepID=T1GRN0_MEGSC